MEEQCKYANRGNNFRPNNNLSAYYHLGLHNQEIFSYANNGNTLQSTSEPTKPSTDKPSSSLEDFLKTYIVDSKARLDQHDSGLKKIKTHCTNMDAMMKALETQVGQLATTIKGQSLRSFSSDTKTNLNE